MAYSEALEQQVKMLRLWESGRGQALAEWLAERRANDLPDMREQISATNFGTMVGRGLSGETFYWSPSVTSVVAATSQDIPDCHLTPEMLPARDGFFWFSGGVALPGDKKGERSLHALSWMTMAQSTPEDSHIRDGVLFRGLSDEEMAARKKVFAIVFYIAGRISSLPDPMTICMWRESWPLSDTIRDMGAALGPQDEDRRIPKLKLFAGCLAFLQQRILVAPRHRVERHAVKRLERDGWAHEPLVRVVELRRRAAPGRPSEDPQEVAWSHQWVVSGHWRQQPYPSLGIVQPRWIMPHLQGPSHLPLKAPRAKVFAVVR